MCSTRLFNKRFLNTLTIIYIICFFMNFVVSYQEKSVIELKYRKSGYHDDIEKVEFSAFNKNFSLNLKKSDLIGTSTPVWLAEYGDLGTEIKKTDPFTVGRAVQFYEDPYNMATLGVAVNKYGNKYFTGIIGNMKIIPLQKRKIRYLYSISDINENHHVVTQLVTNDQYPNVIPSLKHQKILINNISNKSIDANEKLKTVYPEIILIADYGIKFLSSQELKFYNFILYIITFWNSVNLRFKELNDPHVQLRIAGIIVSMHRKAMPLYQSNKGNDKSITGNGALADMGDWFLSHQDIFPLNSFDMVFIMTNSKICQDHERGICGPIGINGMAARKSATCAQKGSFIFEMIAIANDNLKFDGILRSAHEIGHLLGADHDGGRGAEDCSPSAAEMMSPYDSKDLRKLKWSKCSRKSISRHLKSEDASCFRNSQRWKDAGDPVYETLPLLAQCQLRGYMFACEATQGTCSSMKCYSTGWTGLFHAWSCTNTGPAMDGSPCGNGYCRNGTCVASKLQQFGSLKNSF